MENSTENNTLQVEPTNKGGAPTGNQNGKKGKLFYDALRVALVQEDRKTLRKITDTLVKAAMDGEPWAVKEVMDRIDGKPVNTTELGGINGAEIKVLAGWMK